MAAIPTPKSGIEILKNLKDSVNQKTNINNFDATSKARALIDTFQQETLRIAEDSKNAHEAGQLSSARGKALVDFGTSRGVFKNQQQVASVTEEELSLALYVESGTFGDINGGADITVPAGMIIYSEANNNELGTRIRFKTAKAYTLPAADALAYVAAYCEASGSVGNVGHGVLRNHEFTNYNDSGNNSLKVINFYPILNGALEESDSQYRFRIAQNYNRLHQNSDVRILLTSLKVPGVLDAKPIPGYFGIGTVGVVVLAADFQSNQALVDAVQSRLNRYKGPAGQLVALPAAQTLVDMELRIKTARTLNRGETARLKASIRRACNNYFRSLGLGGVIDFNDLASAIQEGSNQLVVLSSRGTNRRMFKNLYVRRGLANSLYSERETVISSTHVLDEDEFADVGSLKIEVI